jgi:hypothetical protein
VLSVVSSPQPCGEDQVKLNTERISTLQRVKEQSFISPADHESFSDELVGSEATKLEGTAAEVMHDSPTRVVKLLDALYSLVAPGSVQIMPTRTA